jgi:hypothetical protein
MCEIAAETFLVPMDNKIRNEIVSREIKEVWNKCEREITRILYLQNSQIL